MIKVLFQQLSKHHALLLLAFILLPVQLQALDFISDGIVYTIIDEQAKTVKTSGVAPDYYNENGVVVLPEKVPCGDKLYELIEIGSSTFDGWTTPDGQWHLLTSITIPNSVITIANGAFSDCMYLSKINIPNSVTTIGDYAFSGSGLQSVSISNSVTKIGAWAFCNCIGLTEVTIPNSVITIGEGAFAWSALENIEWGNSVTEIGPSAFSSCPYLQSELFPIQS